MRSRVPNFVIWTVITTVLTSLTACGNNSERSFPPPPQAVSPSPTEPVGDLKPSGASKLRMRIIDADKFMSLAADHGDNPDFYSIRGAIVGRKKALVELRKGATLCYTKLTHSRVRSGQVLILNDLKGGKSEDANHLYFVTASRVNAETGAAIEVVCIKFNEPIRAGEATLALRGIVEFRR